MKNALLLIPIILFFSCKKETKVSTLKDVVTNTSGRYYTQRYCITVPDKYYTLQNEKDTLLISSLADTALIVTFVNSGSDTLVFTGDLSQPLYEFTMLNSTSAFMRVDAQLHTIEFYSWVFGPIPQTCKLVGSK